MRGAHSLKGACGTLGLLTVVDACQRIEDLSPDANASNVETLLKNLEGEFETATAALKRILEEELQSKAA